MFFLSVQLQVYISFVKLMSGPFYTIENVRTLQVTESGVASLELFLGRLRVGEEAVDAEHARGRFVQRAARRRRGRGRGDYVVI